MRQHKHIKKNKIIRFSDKLNRMKIFANLDEHSMMKCGDIIGFDYFDNKYRYTVYLSKDQIEKAFNFLNKGI